MPNDPRDELHERGLAQSHPLAIAVTGAVMLFLIGAFIVAERAQPAASQNPQVWGQESVTLQNPTAFSPTYRPSAVPTNPEATDTPPIRIFVPPPRPTGSTTPPIATDSAFDAFVKQITGTTFLSTSATGSPKSETSDAYAYVPRGLIATSTDKKRTARQDALYAYGNAAGTVIKHFEDTHPNETAILAAQIADRSDPTKADALKGLGRDLAGVGDNLAALPQVPAEARTAQTALIESYRTIGAKLAAVGDTTNDRDFISAIQDYDAAADVFARNFAALANVFLLADVSFSKYDGGSVFMFSQTAGIR